MSAEAVDPTMEVLVDGLSFPTSVTFDGATIYIAESGLPFGGAPPGGRIWRVTPDGEQSLFAEGLHAPVNGATFHDGYLYVSEGGHPAQISRFDRAGTKSVIVDNLPGPGNYHTNMVAFGPDGKLYFSQGAMTNLGIVGIDSYEVGWLRRLPHAHDIPGVPIALTGINVETPNLVSGQPDELAVTGAFVAFGQRTEPGQRIAPQIPCTAAVMRCNPDGSDLELVAWGLRNAYGLGFLPDGRLVAVDQGADDRGSRPIGNAPDLLFTVRKGAWYGWPDFIGAVPVTDQRFNPSRGPGPTFVLANHDELPPPEPALLHFPEHCAAVKFDIAPDDSGEWGGQIFIALFGDEAPMTAPEGEKAGRTIGRIDPHTWTFHQLPAGQLNRPIDIRFRPTDGALCVLDFGQFEMTPKGVSAAQGSGKLWKVSL